VVTDRELFERLNVLPLCPYEFKLRLLGFDLGLQHIRRICLSDVG